MSNLWARQGIKYLSFKWRDDGKEVIIDERESAVRLILTELQKVQTSGESVLFHSLRGQNRSVCIMIAVLMSRYSWSLAKTIEFVEAKKSKLALRKNFMSQLVAFSKRQATRTILSKDWDSLVLSGERKRLIDFGIDEFPRDGIVSQTYQNSKLADGFYLNKKGIPISPAC